MQTGQVSIWVPIVVGMIGLIGVIAGQLVNAWREDRRWTREQQREEIRWERERDKEQAKLAHDSMIDWRERRLAVYSEYLQAILDTIEMISELYQAKTRAEVETILTRWREHDNTSGRTGQRVRLVASAAVLDLMKHNALTLTAPLFLGVVFPPWPPTDEAPEREAQKLSELRARVASQRNAIWTYYHGLVDLMRSEVGIEASMIEQE